MPSTDALLGVDDLSVGYGRGTTALRGVGLRVPDGAVVSLLGSNGAGKSTLLRAVCGTLPLHCGAVRAGHITLHGRRIEGWSPTRIVEAGVRLVPEGRRIFAGMTVEENLLIGGLRGAGRRQRRERMAELYATFPVLDRKRRQRAVLLSGGEQQMLAIARGLMSRPRLLLLDEPSLGLAPTMISQVADVIRDIAERGTSILLVEQNASLALRLAETVVVLRTGEAVFTGRPEDLQHDDALHRAYFGAADAATSGASA